MSAWLSERSEGQAPTEVDADRGGLGGERRDQRGGGGQDGGDSTNGTHRVVPFGSVCRTPGGCPTAEKSMRIMKKAPSQVLITRRGVHDPARSPGRGGAQEVAEGRVGSLQPASSASSATPVIRCSG
ncbi:hypothetical protein GCM10010301_57140 [Streptomyces plicatus]|nr:hypothetical protein GCM10010301_57140 [Streptomyces plicatus]